MYLIPIPALTDNCLWLLHDGKRALVVDPGDAGPVLRAPEQHALQLESILVTHHHANHAGGVDVLRDATLAAMHGPATGHIPEPTTIGQELLTNPFLCGRQTTIMAASRRFDASAHDDTAVFSAIRQ